jgi:hypothetical protein
MFHVEHFADPVSALLFIRFLGFVGRLITRMFHVEHSGDAGASLRN